jgi:predicted site-specific integrase-resolvase
MKIDNTIIEEEKEEELHVRSHESRSAKFKRMASLRTENIIKHIDVLTNCANVTYYDYTKDEVDQMFNAIESALSDARKTFTKFKIRNRERFRFADK